MNRAEKVLLLRYHHPDGGSKDWAIPVHVPSDRLPVWYGRTGSVLRCAQTPQGRCREGRPHREAADRLAAKVRKGYQELGEFWLDVDCQTLRPVQLRPTPVVPVARPQASSCAWFWRWIAETGPDATLYRACQTVSDDLAASALGPPYPAGNGAGTWCLATNGSQAGQLDPVRAEPAVVAFWLLLARRVPDLSLVDEHQRPVIAPPPGFPVDRATLDTLGLGGIATEDLLATLRAGGAGRYF